SRTAKRREKKKRATSPGPSFPPAKARDTSFFRTSLDPCAKGSVCTRASPLRLPPDVAGRVLPTPSLWAASLGLLTGNGIGYPGAVSCDFKGQFTYKSRIISKEKEKRAWQSRGKGKKEGPAPNTSISQPFIPRPPGQKTPRLQERPGTWERCALRFGSPADITASPERPPEQEGGGAAPDYKPQGGSLPLRKRPTRKTSAGRP
ncbi:hypothetical protein E2320_013210, partial [Naja naja]